MKRSLINLKDRESVDGECRDMNQTGVSTLAAIFLLSVQNRKCLGPETPLLSGIAARMRATPELVRRGIKVAVQHPAKINGLELKHLCAMCFKSDLQPVIEGSRPGHWRLHCRTYCATRILRRSRPASAAVR